LSSDRNNDDNEKHDFWSSKESGNRLNKSVTFVIASFLVIVVIYGLPARHVQLALADQNPPQCSTLSNGDRQCCYETFNDKEIHMYCSTCHTDADGNRSCKFVKEFREDPTHPPTDVAPPSTRTCPDGSAPDANGVCPPTTQAPIDQGTTLPPPDNHKGGNLGQLGGSLLNKDNNNNPSPSTSTGDNNNNDNSNKLSKHHKGSDSLTQADHGSAVGGHD
jgi:hypothetical protein